MFLRIKEYIAAHPNTSMWSAIICSLTAMSTEDWVSLMAAVGLFVSTIWGVAQKFMSEYHKIQENKVQKAHDRELKTLKSKDESDRYRAETAAMLLKLELERLSNVKIEQK